MERTDLVPYIDAELPLVFYQMLMAGVFISLFDVGYISQHHLMEVLSQR